MMGLNEAESLELKGLWKKYESTEFPRDRAFMAAQITRIYQCHYANHVKDLETQLEYYKGSTVLAELTLIRTELRNLAEAINGKL